MAKKNGPTKTKNEAAANGKATIVKIPKVKFRLATLTVTAKVPADVSDQKAAKLVKRLVDIGFEDAAHAPDDWQDKDKAVVDVMTVAVKAPRAVK